MSLELPGQLPLFDPSEVAPPGPARAAATPKPELKLCVLGSGSGGNSTVIQFGDAAMLIDAGFGPLTTARRLAAAKTRLEGVKAIVLTHLDQDHFRPQWVPTLVRWGIHLYVHRWHLADLERLDDAGRLRAAGLIHVFDQEPFEPLPHVQIHAVRLPHDRQGTNAFLVQTSVGRVGYATDLGHVPGEVVARFAGVDLLAIESNYDPDLQRRSSRPLFVKRRIMGKLGHLSNAEAFEAVQQIMARSPRGRPQHIVLLHRSQQCNAPDLVRRLFTRDRQIYRRITLTQQRRCSRWFKIKPLKQMQARQMGWDF